MTDRDELRHKLYIEMCHTIAKFSYAKRRKVGSIIVDTKGRIIGTGYNGTPKTVDNECETTDGTTHPFVIHAELNAIFNATTSNLENCTLYVTMSPCIRCAAAIRQMGFKQVIYDETYRNTDGIELLEQFGVSCINVNSL